MTNMSVFYHNDDPLLTRSIFPQSQQSPNMINDSYAQIYKQQLINEMQQSQQQQKDWVGELDSAMKSLEPAVVERVSSNQDYIILASQLQELIQAELMVLVKYKINSNQNAVENIKKQMEIINNVSQDIKREEKQSINELNDYLKNYSHLSFNEYKKLKNGTQEEDVVETVTTTRKTKQNKIVE